MKSLSAIERANPPPRRKSCHACIKAKRRCDLGQPACLRCTQRLLECRYTSSSVPSSSPRRRHTTGNPSQGEIKEVDAAATPPGSASSNPSSSMLLCSDVLPLTGWDDVVRDLAPSTDLAVDTEIDFLDAPELDMMQFMQDPVIELSAELPSCGQTFTIPRPPSPAYNKLDLLLRHNEEMALSLPVLERWKTAPITDIINHRLQYAIDLVTDAPRRMVTGLQTPWCHPELYRENMPRSMQDALASCGLYLAKNARNSHVILHTIRSRTHDLITATLPPNRPLEVLARVQALLLYVTMLVFDGDISSRSAAEAATPALESAAIGLVGLFGHNPFSAADSSSSQPSPPPPPPPPDSIPLYPIGPARDLWRDWTLQESARRTYMTTFFVLQLYLLLKGDKPKKCDQRLYLCHFWTLSAHLWRAADAFEFAVAWREKRHFVVNQNVIKDVLAEARGDDIEDFGKMIFTTLMGIDETKGWLYSRGSTL